MKKILIIAVLFWFLSVPVSAEEGIYSGAGGIEVEGSPGQFLDDNEVSFDDPESILNLSPSKLWNYIISMVKDKVSEPIKVFASLGAVIVLTVMAESAGDTIRLGKTGKIFELICVLVCVSIAASPVCSVMENCAESLSSGSMFMTGFVPVFAGLAAAGGNITSASGYSIIVMSAADAAIQIADKIMMPMLGMSLSLAIIDAVNPAISLTGLIKGMKKCVTWVLGLIMTIFTGLLSVQSIVGGSADAAVSKTTKYVISGCIPVVGNAVSEAYSSVKTSVGLLKAGVGGIGIAVLAAYLIPPLISLFVYKFVFGASAVAAEIMGAEKLKRLFSNINSVLSSALAVCACFSVMFIISTAIVMAVSTGGV